jgi:hypothetical protein
VWLSHGVTTAFPVGASSAVPPWLTWTGSRTRGRSSSSSASRFVPESIIDARISDSALRLYAVLLRYGQTSGQRMPGRALLARRLQKSSKDTVDRALKELVVVGAVVVERRRAGRQNLTTATTSAPRHREP